MPLLTICRHEHFNAAHRLHNPAWDAARNQLVFGKCNNPNYHGHNYELTVRLTGEPGPDTGYVFDLKELGRLVKQHVLHDFDHRNLNLDVPDFAHLNPTAEHIAVAIWRRLRAVLPPQLALGVTLHETDRNFVAYDGEES